MIKASQLPIAEPDDIIQVIKHIIVHYDVDKMFDDLEAMSKADFKSKYSDPKQPQPTPDKPFVGDGDSTARTLHNFAVSLREVKPKLLLVAAENDHFQEVVEEWNNAERQYEMWGPNKPVWDLANKRALETHMEAASTTSSGSAMAKARRPLGSCMKRYCRGSECDLTTVT